jgi:transcriptional regulator with XRE-family HTH domain
MHERIKQIIENEGLSVRKFEEIISCSNGVIAKVLKKQTDISVKVLISIKEKFPQYSAEWLLTGEGDMYVTGKSPKEDGSDANSLEQRLAEIEKKQEIRDKEMESIMKTLEKISSELTSINEERDKKHHSLCG